LLLIGLRRLRIWGRLRRNGVPVDGRVTAVRLTWWSRAGGYKGVSDWSSIIRYSYRDAHGQVHRGNSGYLSPEETFGCRAGDQCRLKIDPEHADWSLWIGSEERSLDDARPLATQEPNLLLLEERDGRVP